MSETNQKKPTLMKRQISHNFEFDADESFHYSDEDKNEEENEIIEEVK